MNFLLRKPTNYIRSVQDMHCTESFFLGLEKKVHDFKCKTLHKSFL